MWIQQAGELNQPHVAEDSTYRRSGQARLFGVHCKDIGEAELPAVCMRYFSVFGANLRTVIR